MKTVTIFLLCILAALFSGCEENIKEAFPGSVISEASVSSENDLEEYENKNESNSANMSPEPASDFSSVPESAPNEANSSSAKSALNGASSNTAKASSSKISASSATAGFSSPSEASSFSQNRVSSTANPGTVFSSSDSVSSVNNTRTPAAETVKNKIIILMKQKGLTHLMVNQDEKLETAADFRAVEIASLFSHTRPNNSKFSTIFTEVGYTYRAAGENIAYVGRYNLNYTDAELTAAAEDLLTNWWNSDGHRANMQNQQFKKCGLGIYFSVDPSNSRMIRVNAVQLFSD